MDSVISIEAARALVADNVLWPRVRDFLWDFAPQIHASWIDDLTGGAGNPILSEVSGSPRAKAYVLSELGVEPCFHAFPKDDWSRLALLDGATMLEIAKWLGALACAENLRRVTKGATVRELKSALSGVYPDVFSFTAYFSFSSSVDAETPSVQGVVETGCRMLFSVVNGLAEPLQRRLRLKLPKNLCEPGLSAPLRKMHKGMLPKLLKLKFPEAYSLCC